MNKFEEDDGIDMNDIERFLPHLRSVSSFLILFSHLIFFPPQSDRMCWTLCILLNHFSNVNVGLTQRTIDYKSSIATAADNELLVAMG